MKSKLFKYSKALRENPFRLEPLKQDMAAMLSIPVDALPALVEAVRDTLVTKGAEPERIAATALPRLRVGREAFDRACNVAGWLAAEFFPEGFAEIDTTEEIVEDMLTLKVIGDDQKELCATFVSAIKTLVQEQMRAEVEKERALLRGAPKVVGVETAVFFRNVFKKKSDRD